MKYQIPIKTSTKKSKEKKDKYRIASKERKTKALFGVTLSVETPGGWILGEIQFHLLAPASIIYQHPYPPRLKHQIPLHLQKTEKILYFALRLCSRPLLHRKLPTNKSHFYTVSVPVNYCNKYFIVSLVLGL